MNAFNYRGDGSADPFATPLDAVLAEIAVNLQLPPGLHAKAVQRYQAVRAYIERDGSPLKGKVACFYPQGSMAIDATISTRGTDGEYDIDIVAELLLAGLSAKEVLDLLQEALRDYPVKVIRRTRCITLQYADGMHIDVTPSIRLDTAEPRESVIAHAKTAEDQHFVEMNAWGFCHWYRGQTPTEERFAKAFNRRLYELAGLELKADAEVHEVPEQAPFRVKSATTVALQLKKRFRNILYQDETGRLPPSVMLSCHAGHAAVPGIALSDMLIRQARWTARAIDDAERDRRLLDVRNPMWREDNFTDRWPENRDQQRFFARHLHGLADSLEAAKRGMQLEDLQTWLRTTFGDRVVTRSIEGFNDRMGRTLKSTGQSYTRSGGLYFPSAPALITGVTAIAPVTARAHTNMGERR